MEINVITAEDHFIQKWEKIEINEECFLKRIKHSMRFDKLRRDFTLAEDGYIFLCKKKIQPGDDIVVIQEMGKPDEWTWTAKITELDYESNGENFWRIEKDGKNIGICQESILANIIGKLP